MAGRKLGDKLKLFDQYIHELVKRCYVRPSLEGFGVELSSSELFACNVIGRKGKCTMSQLARECDFPLSSMTGMVDRLVAKGCMRRARADEEDRRKVFVELDGKGEKIYQELLELEMEMIISVMESLRPPEQDALLDALGKAVDSLNQQ